MPPARCQNNVLNTSEAIGHHKVVLLESARFRMSGFRDSLLTCSWRSNPHTCGVLRVSYVLLGQIRTFPNPSHGYALLYSKPAPAREGEGEGRGKRGVNFFDQMCHYILAAWTPPPLARACDYGRPWTHFTCQSQSCPLLIPSVSSDKC
jgi:hypothetical protein